MRPVDLDTVARRVSSRAHKATGIRAPFEVVEDEGVLALTLFGERLVTVAPDRPVREVLAASTSEEVGTWFTRELLEVRGWTAEDLVQVRTGVMEDQLDRVQARVSQRVAKLLLRPFVDPRACLHGPFGGVVGSLRFTILSAPPPVPDPAGGTGSDGVGSSHPAARDLDGPAGPDALDDSWPPAGLHVTNDTSVEVFIPSVDDPRDRLDLGPYAMKILRQIQIPCGPDETHATAWARRELKAHGEAYLRPHEGEDHGLDEDAFRRTVAGVSAEIDVPHRLEVEGFRARLVRRDDDG